MSAPEPLAGVSLPVFATTPQGVYGLEAVLADFDPGDLTRLRDIAHAIRTPELPSVQSAIALAGSAAQSRIQPFPSDCDYFERVHVEAPTREAAAALLAEAILATVAGVFTDTRLRFNDLKLGVNPEEARHGDDVVRPGSPLAWTLPDLDARRVALERADGTTLSIDLHRAAHDPGFTKLEWSLTDEEHGRVLTVSKVLDVTWGTPDGRIVALDGLLDAFYQEVYLDPDTRAHVEELLGALPPDGLRDYVDRLEDEVRKHIAPGHEQYGKAAKRLYNIFRITGRPSAAAHVRGVFDDPPARLHQVAAQLDALRPLLGTARIGPGALHQALAGMEESLRLGYDRPGLDGLIADLHALETADPETAAAICERIEAATTACVSDHIERELRTDPEVAAYLDALSA